MLRIDATTVLTHRVLITNVRESAESEGMTCEEFLMHEKAEDHGGLLQTVGIQLQYPMGWGIGTIEEFYHTIGIGEEFMKGTVYEALQKIVETIFGASAVRNIPKPWQFD